LFPIFLFPFQEAYHYYLIRRPSLSEKGLFDILPRALKIKVLNLKYRKEIMGIDIFHNFDPAFVVELLLHSKPYCMRPGEVIYGIGDVADEMTFILRGCVRMDIPCRETRTKKINNTAGFATTGWFFGDFEYFKQTPRIANYTAGQSCTLLSMSYANISEAIKNCPVAGAAFMSMLSDRFNLFKVQLKKESPFYPVKDSSPDSLRRVNSVGEMDSAPPTPSPTDGIRRKSTSRARSRSNSVMGAR
jgi:CRP-like cAMP-binding protein